MNREKQRLAQGLARAKGIPLGVDFYALPLSQKAELAEIAKVIGYRAPRNASGSAARCFFYYMQKGA